MDSVRTLAGVGDGVFALVETIVGIRLLLVWRRASQLPEMLEVALGLAPIGPGRTALDVFSARCSGGTRPGEPPCPWERGCS